MGDDGFHLIFVFVLSFVLYPKSICKKMRCFLVVGLLRKEKIACMHAFNDDLINEMFGYTYFKFIF